MRPIVLTIMDGAGLAKPSNGNAFDLASKPNLDRMLEMYPHTTLNASGQSVGLPAKQMGNSEVGHLNIGAGRVVYQQLELINKSFAENTIIDNKIYNELINFAKNNNNVIHIMGLLSDGGVHSHINHIIEMIKHLDDEGIKIYVHAFYDGRDVGPKTARSYINIIENLADELDNAHIVSAAGRFYAMDRDTNYERTKKAYNAIVNADALKYESILDGLESSYSEEVFDENIIPYVLNDYEGVKDGDAFVFMNFRPDRAIQISNAIIDKNFNAFGQKKFDNIYFATISKYTRVNSSVMFEAKKIKNGLGEFLSAKGFKQLRIAETEKYAHVTFFFDGGIEQAYPGMNKVLVNSPKVATYDMQPEMSANEVTDKLLKELDNNYDVVILNYANPDMVGHTGNIPATIKAVETVDYNIGRVYEKVCELGGVMLITADHGNSERLLDEEGNIVTAHTLNRVPFIVTNKEVILKENMSLCDIAPTIIKLLGEKQPQEMSGKSIIMEEI
ncbi:MAG: 2,3-bisphosphoglycerate-independent phosphoglycerate mutase [Bacilli bacterium]